MKMDKKTKRIVARELRQEIVTKGYGIKTKVINKNTSTDIILVTELATETLIKEVIKITQRNNLSVFASTFDKPYQIKFLLYGGD
jgi:hypothetical protein